MDYKSDKPIYVQIFHYLCEKILQKTWKIEDRVPSVRELGVELGVNPNTVAKAYEKLEILGIIYNKRGIGFFVSQEAEQKIEDLFKQEFFQEDLPQIFKKMNLLNINLTEISEKYTDFLKKTNLLIFFLLLSVFSLQAQGRANFSGKLLDATSQEPVLFANIVLLNAVDSSMVKGGSSDESGGFLFEGLHPGNYKISISAIGYHPYTTPSMALKKGERKEIGMIKLQPSSLELSEVVIEAKKPLMEQEAGKLVYNVAASTSTEGDNAFELLKKFPGVMVDNDDNISLNGKSGIMIMIDNRPSYLSGTELINMLKTMPASNIEKIESINNPSSKYDAEGTGGILNLVTKRNKMIGFSGSVFAGVGWSNQIQDNAGGDISFRNNKLTVNASLNFYHQKGKNGWIDNNTFADGTRYLSNTGEGEKWNSSSNYLSLSGKFALDYVFDRKNSLNMSYQGSGRGGGNSANAFTRIFPQDTVASSFEQLASSEWNGQNHNLSLNYQHIFDTSLNRQLFVDANYVRNSQGVSGYNAIRYYLGDIPPAPLREYQYSAKEDYSLSRPISSNIISAKIDYEHPFTTKTKLEVGGKVSLVYNDNNMVYSDSNSIIDINRTNQYLYREIISAAYGIFSHSFSDNTSLEVGLRAENTTTQGHSYPLDSINKRNYFGLFPNLNFMQKINTNHTLNFSYRYRLSRPNYTHLNPFSIRNTQNQYYVGNPFLNPEYSHNFNLSYSYGYSFFATLSYSHSDGDIDQLSFYDNSHISYTQPQNMGKSDALSLSLSYQKDFFTLWKFSIYANGSYSKTSLNYRDKQETTNSYYTSFWMSNNFTLPKDFGIELTGWASLPGQSLFSKNKGQYALNLGLKKSFLKKSLTVSLSLNDIFNTASSWVNDEVYPDGTKVYSEYFWAGRRISAKVSYRFGKGNIQNRVQRKAAEDELQRMGGDSQGGGGIGG